MSLSNSYRVVGNVSHIDKEPNPGGGTKYTIRLGVRIDDANDPRFGKKDFVTVTAFGTSEGDPWASLERGDDCVIECEAHGEGEYTVIVGIALRRPFPGEC